jgi:SAM-dependent methyltransferase
VAPSEDSLAQQEEARQRSRAVWNAMASGWQEQREELWNISRPVSEWMIRKLDPQPGDAVLELAAGLGETGFMVARLVGETGRVIATDFATEMVAAARRRAEELGIRNVELRVLDAERMDLETDSVDGVLCRWGYMLMVDPAAAFAETRRVLRPGGRLAFSVWAGPERNPWDRSRRPTPRRPASSPWLIQVEYGSLSRRPHSPSPRSRRFSSAGPLPTRTPTGASSPRWRGLSRPF